MNIKFFFLLVFIACFVVNTSAQFSSSGSGSSIISTTNGWNTVYVEWNPSKLSFSGNKRNKVDFYGAFNGFSLGANKAFSVSSEIPLFIETGLAGQFSFNSESNKYSYWEESTKFSMLSLKVPVNVMYRFDITNTDVFLIPFIGVTLRGNVWGKMKWEEYDYHDDGLDDYSSSLFDKHDMGYLVGYQIINDEYDYDELDYTWKRVQIGWQVGLKAHIANFLMVTGSFGTDFNRITQNYKVHTGTFSVGYTF